ncbi:MAG: arginine deiminase family protein [Anaerolineales bacterium]
MYTRAIVKTPGKSIVEGLTTAVLGIPDYQKALNQHREYIEALQNCGLEVLVLEADEDYPDSTFVEDTALLTPQCAIITNPGAPSRKGETAAMIEVLQDFYTVLEKILPPGTVEGGDILKVGTHYYIGLSERTNLKGAQQVIEILNEYGLDGSMVQLDDVLHLKTGISYLEGNIMAACGEFLSKAEFKKYKILAIAQAESYAANCLWINGTVLVPQGFPQTQEAIEHAGYRTKAVDVSEFRKMDGGLSCLSLRF